MSRQIKAWTDERRGAGFTLIEMMIAVAILAMITVMSWASVTQILRAEADSNGRDERVHAARVMFNKLFQDATQAFLVGATHKGIKGSVKPGFIGTASSIDFATLACRRFMPNQVGADQCEVGYRLEADEEDTNLYRLMRREAAVIDDKPEEGGKAYVVLSGIKNLEFEYYNAKSKEWKREWNSTEVAQFDRLPSAIRFTLTMTITERDDTEIDEVWQSEILIPLEGQPLEF